MTDKDYTQINREMWNQTAKVHQKATLSNILSAIHKADYSCLDPIESALLTTIGVKAKDVTQLSCNNGRELISVKKMGAARCVGFDISDAFIAQAQQLAQHSQEEGLEFIRCNIYDIDERYNNSFDLVYVTVGALGWLADIEAYFKIVARLLRPQGQVFIYEMHPMLDMFDTETGLEIKHSYFRTEPYVIASAPDYMDPSQVVEASSYWFHHKISDIISAMLAAGLRLRHFKEYEHDVSAVFRAFQDFALKPALSYTLIASKAHA